MGFLMASAAFALVAWAPSIEMVGLGFFLAAVGSGAVWVFSGTLAQHASEGGFRGRVFAVEWGAMTLASAAAAWGGGVAADSWNLSPRQIAMALAAYMLFPALIWPVFGKHAPE